MLIVNLMLVLYIKDIACVTTKPVLTLVQYEQTLMIYYMRINPDK